MPELLKRKRQLALLTETTKGTFNTALNTDSTAATNANLLLIDPTYTPNILQFERAVQHPSLTMVEGFYPGVAWAQISCSYELAGHRSNDGVADHVEPPIGPILAACGMTSAAVTPWNITGYTTGTQMLHGETVTGGTSTETATVVGNTVEDHDTILYLLTSSLSGTFTSGETLTGGTSGTALNMTTSPLLTAEKWAFFPNSDASDGTGSIPTLSGIYYRDGIRTSLAGMRGTVVFEFPHADRCKINVVWTGVITSEANGILLEGANLPVIDHPKPPAVLGTGLVMATDVADIAGTDWSPVYNSMTIDLGNNVILRENSSSSTGYSFASMSAKAPTLTFNPDEILPGTHDLFTNFNAGNAYNMRFTLGSTATATNLGGGFEFRIPAFQVTSAPEGDRDEVTTREITGNLTGGETSGVLGVDNELVIINL